MSQREVDAALVERAQKGDEKAFEVLVRKYQRKVARLLSRFFRNADEIEDVTQETFIKAYRALGAFRGESAFYTWLFRIAVNTAKNHLQQKERRARETLAPIEEEVENGTAVPFDEMAVSFDTPENELLSRQIAEAIVEAIESLPDELRTAIVLREVEGLSYDEIAKVTECPIGTVRSRIFRARETIAEQIRPLLDVGKGKRW